MNTLRVLLAIWAMGLGLILSIGCSQDSSRITPSQQQPSAVAPDNLENVIPEAQIGTANKPVGNLANHAQVDAGHLQFADSNPLVSLNGGITFRSALKSCDGIPVPANGIKMLGGTRLTAKVTVFCCYALPELGRSYET